MKRALFLALLLANLGFFAWYLWYLSPGANPALAPPLKGQTLKLIAELTPAEKKSLAAAPPPSSAPATAAAATTAPAATTAVLACATYGPFPGTDAVDTAETRLKGLGLQASDHLVPGKSKLGYWVYLPPFGSKHEADAATDLLRRRGVSDIYVVTDEANRNAVSLGVFSQHAGALERIKQLKKLGYHPQTAERFRDEPRYWLDAKGALSALPGAEAFKDLGEEGSPIGKATVPCGA